jgi:hypothetical protein
MVLEAALFMPLYGRREVGLPGKRVMVLLLLDTSGLPMIFPPTDIDRLV